MHKEEILHYVLDDKMICQFYFETISFTDYNDKNENSRTQSAPIIQTLAYLQAQKAIADKPRNPIGFKKNPIGFKK